VDRATPTTARKTNLDLLLVDRATPTTANTNNSEKINLF